VRTLTGILEDVYETPTWQALRKAGQQGFPTGWIYDWHGYMHRPEWQLYDLDHDPLSLENVAASRGDVLSQLRGMLQAWRNMTHDPWLPCNTDSEGEICSV
jgi:N-sulfoglucosamine sulfohydrolase